MNTRDSESSVFRPGSSQLSRLVKSRVLVAAFDEQIGLVSLPCLQSLKGCLVLQAASACGHSCTSSTVCQGNSAGCAGFGIGMSDSFFRKDEVSAKVSPRHPLTDKKTRHILESLSLGHHDDDPLTKGFTMSVHIRHPAQVPIDDDELEPGLLPVEPDEGPMPTGIPPDPEHDRVVDPEA